MTCQILAIESSSETCSVALNTSNGVDSMCTDIPRGHADHILPMIEALLSKHAVRLQDLDALACSIGPGAFTSVRIGTSVTQGLALGANLNIVTASSLHIMAQQAAASTTEHEIFLVALDARMNEVYFGVYGRLPDGNVTPLQDDQVSRPELIALELEADQGAIGVLGRGWDAYPEAMEQRFSAYHYQRYNVDFPHAEALMDIALNKYREGAMVSADRLLPVYVRDRVVST